MANIVLLDDKGVAQTYNGITSATFNTAEGGLVTFKAPEEHNVEYDYLEQLMLDYSDEYAFYSRTTAAGKYVYSPDIRDFGIWFIYEGNAYHIVETGSFSASYALGRFVAFCAGGKWSGTGADYTEAGSIYYHDGNASHQAEKIYSINSPSSTSWSAATGLVLKTLYVSGQRVCILFHDSFAAPIVVTDMVGGTSTGGSWSTVTQLSDTCFIVQTTSPTQCGGALLVHTSGTVTCFEPFVNSNYQPPTSMCRVSDTLYAMAYYASGPLVLINIANNTFEVLSSDSLGAPYHYHVASSTLFCANGATHKYFCLADGTSGTVSGTTSSSHMYREALNNNCLVCTYACSLSKDKLGDNKVYKENSYTTVSTSNTPGSYNYGFSILDCASRSFTADMTGRYDWSSIYYNGGSIALIIPTHTVVHGSVATEYTDCNAYVLNVNTCVCTAITYAGSNVMSQVYCDLEIIAKSTGRQSGNYTYYDYFYVFVRPNVYFSDPNTAYILFSRSMYSNKLFKLSAGNAGALDLVYQFATSASGYTVGASLPSNWVDVINEYMGVDNTYAAQTRYNASLHGRLETGPAKVYSIESSGTATSAVTCVIIKQNSEPVTFTKTKFYASNYGFSYLTFSSHPIKDNIYAGVDGNGAFFLLNLDDLSNPIKDTFIVPGSDTPQCIKLFLTHDSSIVYNRGCRYYNSVTLQVPFVSTIEIAPNESCVVISAWPSALVLTSDLTRLVGVNTSRITYTNAYNSGVLTTSYFSSVYRDKLIRAFDFSNAIVEQYTGDIASLEYNLVLRSNNGWPIVICVRRRTNTSSSSMQTLSANMPCGIYNEPYWLYATSTPSGALYSRSKNTSTGTSDYTSILFFPYSDAPVTPTVLRPYNKDINWTECYPSTEPGIYELFRAGLPHDTKYLLWDDEAKTITEVIVDNNS